MAKGAKTGGRKKGTPNKSTAAVKEAIEAAYGHLGGDVGFGEWAKKNQDTFYTQLFPRLLPIQMQHAGADGGPVEVSMIERLVRPANRNG